jgi:Zinc finger protein
MQHSPFRAYPTLTSEHQRASDRQVLPCTLIPEIKASDTNQDCLIRPYLGRRRNAPGGGGRPSRFSLRNFPLRVDQMEQSGICADIEKYAEMMAEALATIHWYGERDANDVEFVLAPPRNETQPKLSNILGDHTMWLLDFDCCRRMSMDEKGVDQAVAPFF